MHVDVVLVSCLQLHDPKKAKIFKNNIFKDVKGY